MKFIKSALCLLLVMLISAGMLVGCVPTDGTEKPITGADGATVNGTGSNQNGSASAANDITIEEQVLLDQNNLKVTAKEFVQDSIMGAGIKVLIESGATEDITLSCNALIVNDYMITDLFVATVAAGKKANETIYLSSSQLEAAGITNIGKIEIYFDVYDADSYDTLFEPDVATIHTSAYTEMDSEADVTGTILYEKDGFKIIGKYVTEDSFWGSAVLLYLENNTDRAVTFSCEDMSINGFMVQSFFYGEVYAGKKAVKEIHILSTDLEKNDITTINELELAFEISDSATFEVIAETDPVKMTVGA